MNPTCRVLALNDDCHDIIFVSLTHNYGNVTEFMRNQLLQPHLTNYIVKVSDYIDIDENDIESIKMYDLLYSTDNIREVYHSNPQLFEERVKAFDYFWERGKDNFYI